MEGARKTLVALKPLIARTRDKKLIGAFDTLAKVVQGKSTGKTSGGYGKFAKAANQRGKDAQDSVDIPNKHIKQMQEAEKLYRERFVARH